MKHNDISDLAKIEEKQGSNVLGGYFKLMQVITMREERHIQPAWGLAIFILANVINYFIIDREQIFFENTNIYNPPQPLISVWLQPAPLPPSGEVPLPAVGAIAPTLIYFTIAIVILGFILFLVPLSYLRLLLRILSGLLFAWAGFIFTISWFPIYAAVIVSLAVDLAWYFFPRVWLHNLVLLIAMVSLAAVLGPLFSPWTLMIILLGIALYKLLAVRFGNTLWIARNLSSSHILPAFIIPQTARGWNTLLPRVPYFSARPCGFSLNGFRRYSRPFDLISYRDSRSTPSFPDGYPFW